MSGYAAAWRTPPPRCICREMQARYLWPVSLVGLAPMFASDVHQFFAECHLEQLVNQLPHLRVELFNPLRGVNILSFPGHLFCFAILAFHLWNEAVCHRVAQGVEAFDRSCHLSVELSNFLSESQLLQHE